MLPSKVPSSPSLSPSDIGESIKDDYLVYLGGSIAFTLVILIICRKCCDEDGENKNDNKIYPMIEDDHDEYNEDDRESFTDSVLASDDDNIKDADEANDDFDSFFDSLLASDNDDDGWE